MGLLRDEVEEWVRVGAREGEFRVDEEAVEEDLSLREKRPIVVDVVVALEQVEEWDRGWLSRGAGVGGEDLRSRQDDDWEMEGQVESGNGRARGADMPRDSTRIH